MKEGYRFHNKPYSKGIIGLLGSLYNENFRTSRIEIQIQDLMQKKYIRSSVSPWIAPLLFLKNKYGTLRMCIDYR